MSFSVTKRKSLAVPRIRPPRQTCFALAFSLSLCSFATATEITLDRAVERALALAQFDELRAAAASEADGRLRSARALPNPSLFYERESLGGSTGDFRETTAGVTMPLDFIWKRAARIDAAQSQSEIALLQLEDHRRRIVREVSSLFVEHAATTEEAARYESAHDAMERARRIALAVTREGDAPESLLRRVDLSISRYGFEEAGIEARRQEIQSRLESLVGLENLSPDSSVFTLDRPEFSSAAGAQETALAERPDLRVAEMLLAWKRAELRVARNEGRPSASLQAGHKEDNSGRDGFIIGLTVELPIFDRNQGGAQVSKAEAVRAEVTYGRARRIVEAEARSAYVRWNQLNEQWRRLTAPEPSDNAEAFLKSTLASFEAGESSLIEYLDAVETYLEAWGDQIQLQEARRRAAIELAYATAANIQR